MTTSTLLSSSDIYESILWLPSGNVADPNPRSGIRNRFFRIPDLGSWIPKTYFWELSDSSLEKKCYNSLKTGPNLFLQHFKNRIISNFAKFMATKKGVTTIFYHLLFCCCFWIRDPRSGTPDPGWVKIRIGDKHPGSAALLLGPVILWCWPAWQRWSPPCGPATPAPHPATPSRPSSAPPTWPARERTEESGRNRFRDNKAKEMFYMRTLIHCKKKLVIFPSPAGMSLTKLIPAGEGKIANLFLQCMIECVMPRFEKNLIYVTISLHCEITFLFWMSLIKLSPCGGGLESKKTHRKLPMTLSKER